MSNVSKSSSGKVYLSGNDRLTVEQRREVKRNAESARTFQHNRRMQAHRAEVLNQMVNKQYDPVQSIGAKARRMAEKLQRYCAS